jgi:CheY-like chemotaxis protein
MVWMPECYELAIALSGNEGVSKALEFQPDCIMMNFMMPGIAGIEAANLIRPRLPRCKFIFITGQAGEPEFQGLLRDSGYDERFVPPKPFRAHCLYKMLVDAGCPQFNGS